MKGKEVKKIVLNLEPPPKRKKNSFRLLALGISLLLSTSTWLLWQKIHSGWGTFGTSFVRSNEIHLFFDWSRGIHTLKKLKLWLHRL